MTEEEALFAQLEEEMALLPCESPMHGKSDQHEGPGVWYMTASCPLCGDGPDRSLVCDRYKQLLPAMVTMTGTTVVKCSYCEEYFLSREITYHFERREP